MLNKMNLVFYRNESTFPETPATDIILLLDKKLNPSNRSVEVNTILLSTVEKAVSLTEYYIETLIIVD